MSDSTYQKRIKCQLKQFNKNPERYSNMNILSFNQSSSSIGIKFDNHKSKRSQLMSAKTRATPNEHLNSNLPRHVLTKSLEADQLHHILQNKKNRLPSAVTTNTVKLKTIEPSFENSNQNQPDFRQENQHDYNYLQQNQKGSSSSNQPINSIFNAPMYMQRDYPQESMAEVVRQQQLDQMIQARPTAMSSTRVSSRQTRISRGKIRNLKSSNQVRVITTHQRISSAVNNSNINSNYFKNTSALVRERSPSSHAEQLMMNDYATIPVKSKPLHLQEELMNSKLETGSYQNSGGYDMFASGNTKNMNHISTTNFSERQSPIGKKNGTQNFRTMTLQSPQSMRNGLQTQKYQIEEVDDGVSSKDSKYAAVRHFLKKPNAGLKYVRELKTAQGPKSRLLQTFNLTSKLSSQQLNQTIQPQSEVQSSQQVTLVAGFRYQEPDVISNNARERQQKSLSIHRQKMQASASLSNGARKKPPTIPGTKKHITIKNEQSYAGGGQNNVCWVPDWQHFRNQSAKAILKRKDYATSKNVSACRTKLNILSMQKEQHQYKSYLGNVETLNQMKKAFKEVYPSMREADNGRKQKKMVGIIMNYERDIQNYVDSWQHKVDSKKLGSNYEESYGQQSQQKILNAKKNLGNHLV